jgi:hypothetical protein
MKLALCVGINDYPGTDMDLAGCSNDAKDWAKALKANDFEVETLFDKEATGDHILSGIERLVMLAEKGDSIVITYSGHGSFVPDESGDEEDGCDECLCPYDIIDNGPIVDDELGNLFSEIRDGVKAVFLSDSCHSGTVAKFMPILTPPTTTTKSAPQRTIRFMPPGVFLPKKALKMIGQTLTCRPTTPSDESRMLLIAGCQDVEYSYDAYFKGRPNGAFTFCALKALNEMPGAGTGLVNYAQWFKAIRRMLPSRQYPQSPSLVATKIQKRWRVFS